MELRKLDFVIQQLDSYAGEKKLLNGISTFVCCPYHAEKTPSFRIFHSPVTKSPGWGRCYGCGASHPWDQYAEKLGLKPYEYAKPTEQFTRTRIVREIEDLGPPEKLVLSDLPENKVWRSIKTNFLIQVGCQRATNEWGTPFVYMPVVILGEERGYIKARLRKVEDKPSYINKKGSWSSDYGLFPYDYAVRTKPAVIVLVEGPRDSLRLNSLGIPTMAILGTQSWSDRKSRLVALSGAKHVILMMDGDDAGIAAEKKIQPLLEKVIDVTTFSLYGDDSPYHQFAEYDHPTKMAKKKGVTLWDPGNCPLPKLKELKRLIRSLTTEKELTC